MDWATADVGSSMKAGLLGLAALVAASLGGVGLAHADAEEDAHGKAVAGEEQLTAKKFADAARTFEEAYKLHPLPMYQRKLGEAHKGAQDCQKAIAAFQAYFEKSKDQDVLRDIQSCKETLAKGGPAGMRGEGLVQVMLRQGRYQEALAAARKLGEDGKDTAASHTLVGEALLAVGEEKRAMARFEKAIKADAKSFHARILLGLAELGRGETSKGKRTLDKFFDHYNNDELKSASDLTDADIPAWEEIEAGRFMPRRIRGSFRGRTLG